MSEREFPADVQAPSDARAFARRTLGEILSVPVPPALCDDVELIVSELVTNAVRAGSATVTLELVLVGPARVAVRVSDEAEGWPQPRDAGIHDLGGRGLALVSAIADTWGVLMTHSSKTVWAELRVIA